MMSRFGIESNSAIARPQPIPKGQNGGGANHDEFSPMHPRHEHCGEKKRKYGKGSAAATEP